MYIGKVASKWNIRVYIYAFIFIYRNIYKDLYIYRNVNIDYIFIYSLSIYI